MRISWTRPASGCGAYFASKDSFNASSLQYVVVNFMLYDTTGSSTAKYTFYASVNSSRTSLPSDDSGVATYGEFTAATSTSSSNNHHAVINMTNCTRSGYFKFGCIQTRNLTSTSDDSGRLYLYDIAVYNSYPPTLTRMFDCTMT